MTPSRNRRPLGGDTFPLAEMFRRAPLALDASGKPSNRRELDASGSCESPVIRHFEGLDHDYYKEAVHGAAARSRAEEKLKLHLFANDRSVSWRSMPIEVGGYERPKPLYRAVTMYVPCRKCRSCLRYRSRQWAARAINESTRAKRSWFGTLTLNPKSLAYFKMKSVSDDPKFHDVVRAVGPEITKFLKRVRKISRARLRFFCVAEPHTGKYKKGAHFGEPHLHMLLHEVSWTPVTSEILIHRHCRKTKKKRTWESRRLGPQWPFGFTKWRTVKEDDNIAYACKYLAKDLEARPRASVRYGKRP